MLGEFPQRDPMNVAVRWAPLLVCPIPWGHERFVAAIAAKGRAGEIGCLRLIDGRRMNALFQNRSAQIGAVVDASVESMRDYLENAVELDGWHSPFEGVHLGDESTVYVRRFSDAFPMAAKLCAAFGELKFPEQVGANPVAAGPWQTTVTDLLRQRCPGLSNSIDAQIALGTTRHTISFTFYGVDLAANFVLLNPQRLAASLREARAHLWNLSLIADAPEPALPTRPPGATDRRQRRGRTRERGHRGIGIRGPAQTGQRDEG